MSSLKEYQTCCQKENNNPDVCSHSKELLLQKYFWPMIKWMIVLCMIFVGINAVSKYPINAIKENGNITDQSINRQSSMPTYIIGGIHKLRGTISLKNYHGSPGFDKNKIDDQKFNTYILRLDSPINAIAVKNDKLSYSIQTNEIQVVNESDVAKVKHAFMMGKSITIRGELFVAYNDYHIKKVFLYVKPKK